MDPVALRTSWNRLIALVNEQAASLQRTAFSNVVREAGDLSAGIFDRQGRMLAQAVTGTTGHINTMAQAFFLSGGMEAPPPRAGGAGRAGGGD